MLVFFCSLRAQKILSVIPDSVTYEVINTFCRDDYHKRISRSPVRYVFYNNYDSILPSGYRLTGADLFLDRVKEWDTSKIYFHAVDYLFMKHQIDSPSLVFMDHRKIKGTRVMRKQRFIPMTYAISLPVFSKDMQTAIIAGSYWGMSRVFLYRRDSLTQQWKLCTMLWQDGS